jgi:hypothetical protein
VHAAVTRHPVDIRVGARLQEDVETELELLPLRGPVLGATDGVGRRGGRVVLAARGRVDVRVFVALEGRAITDAILLLLGSHVDGSSAANADEFGAYGGGILVADRVQVNAPAKVAVEEEEALLG